jgi:hypothetical protein
MPELLSARKVKSTNICATLLRAEGSVMKFLLSTYIGDSEPFFRTKLPNCITWLSTIVVTSLVSNSAISVADRLSRPLIQPRAGGIKDHGTGKLVEGVYAEGQTVTLIEDLVTSATSVFETQDDKLTPSGLVLANVVSLVCRDQVGLKAILGRQLTYEHAITLERIMKALGQTGKVEALESGLRGRVEAYINR